jgi:hypothetical protein
MKDKEIQKAFEEILHNNAGSNNYDFETATKECYLLFRRLSESTFTFDTEESNARVFVIERGSDLHSITFHGNLHGLRGYDTLEDAMESEDALINNPTFTTDKDWNTDTLGKVAFGKKEVIDMSHKLKSYSSIDEAVADGLWYLEPNWLKRQWYKLKHKGWKNL